MMERRHFLIALLGLQLADVATTWIALGFGTNHEGNPFAAWVLAFGLPGLLIAKAIGTLLLVILTFAMGPHDTRVGRWADATIMACCAIMLLVVLNNWTILLEAKP